MAPLELYYTFKFDSLYELYLMFNKISEQIAYYKFKGPLSYNPNKEANISLFSSENPQ